MLSRCLRSMTYKRKCAFEADAILWLALNSARASFLPGKYERLSVLMSEFCLMLETACAVIDVRGGANAGRWVAYS